MNITGQIYWTEGFLWKGKWLFCTNKSVFKLSQCGLKHGRDESTLVHKEKYLWINARIQPWSSNDIRKMAELVCVYIFCKTWYILAAGKCFLATLDTLYRSKTFCVFNYLIDGWCNETIMKQILNWSPFASCMTSQSVFTLFFGVDLIWYLITGGGTKCIY